MFLVMASESVKAVYERARRKRHSDERRVYQVLYPWLRIMHPEVFLEFDNFFTQLAVKNLCTKNLTTSDNFKHFYRRGKGGYYVFFYSVEYTTSYFLLYGNFVDFTFETDAETVSLTTAESTAAESTAVESTTAESTTTESTTTESTSTESTTTESTTTTTTAESDTPERDPIAEVTRFMEDFDYEVEVFDWENFEDDIDFFEGMDLSGYLDDNRFF
jgi:cell division septation protein DedD